MTLNYTMTSFPFAMLLIKSKWIIKTLSREVKDH